MEEKSRLLVGLDIGTGFVRGVAGSFDREGRIVILGYGEAPSSGLRKGVVVDLNGPLNAIDLALKAVEDMSGEEIDYSTTSVNGVHILNTKTDGMIAVGLVDHEIDEADLDRVDLVAATGKIPTNREILDLVPYEYALDGQGGIKDPIGMKGSRLEIRASVVSGLIPYCENVRKTTEAAHVKTTSLMASVVAASKAVLSTKQKENGVAVIDLGFATTGVTVFDEGDLQYVGVVPIGSNKITNDLAIVLQTTPDIAEEIKLRFVTCNFGASEKDIVIKRDREEFVFSRAEVDEIVKACLDDIFEAVRKELKRAGYDMRLPEGVVLTGGGAKLRDIEVYAKEKIELAARIGTPEVLGGVSEAVSSPEYATAVGLMLANAGDNVGPIDTKKKKQGVRFGAKLKKIFGKF